MSTASTSDSGMPTIRKPAAKATVFPTALRNDPSRKMAAKLSSPTQRIVWIGVSRFHSWRLIHALSTIGVSTVAMISSAAGAMNTAGARLETDEPWRRRVGRPSLMPAGLSPDDAVFRPRSVADSARADNRKSTTRAHGYL